MSGCPVVHCLCFVLIVAALTGLSGAGLNQSGPSMDQLRRLYEMSVQERPDSVRVLAVKVVAQEALSKSALEARAKAVADSFTPAGPGQENVFEAEMGRAIESLSGENNGARVYKEQEWQNGIQYRYDQAVAPGMDASVLLEREGFLRSYVQLGDIWKGDYRTIFIHHGVRMAQQDDRESGLRAPLGLTDGNRMSLEVRRILLAGLGRRTPDGKIEFDSEKAMRLASKGEEGVRLTLQRRDTGLRFEVQELRRSSPLRVRLDFDSPMRMLERLELYDVEGKLVYRDVRSEVLDFGYPKDWMTVRLTPEGYVTNQVTFLEIEMNPEFPKDLFEFRPPESYSIYEGDRMVRNVMFGGERLPMESTVQVRSNTDGESSRSQLSKQRKVWLFRGFYLCCLFVGSFSLVRYLRSRST